MELRFVLKGIVIDGEHAEFILHGMKLRQSCVQDRCLRSGTSMSGGLTMWQMYVIFAFGQCEAYEFINDEWLSIGG